VVTKLTDVGMPEDEIATALEVLGLEIVDFDSEAAFRAGRLRSKTRSAGLSLGDRACLAVADALGLPALTADRQWKDLNVGIEIHCIR
jgi:PIN domain nuclease of toxin-antitoxin system